MTRVAGVCLATWLLFGVTVDAVRASEPSFSTIVERSKAHSGLVTFYADGDHGKLWLELPPGENGVVGEYIYVEGLATGLGSNPVGLDRGQLGDSRLVVLRRVGDRLLVEQPNLGYRAISDNSDEARATRQSFATSVLWAGKIGPAAEDGRSLVDITSFLIRDAHGVSQRLRETGQGEFSLDRDRSVVDFDAALAFPDNVELEAILTYGGGGEIGNHVRSTAPTESAITLVQHHSLIRLPEPGYKPRAFDPRGGNFAIQFQDYAVPLDASIERRWIVRHRLKKGDSLVYYVDRGAPEPVRSALLDGARWWADAFEAAGFPGTYRVELMPEGAHPLDVRYNVIQWVHRSTRGWSYGGGITDPRTGEMLKGHVSLGSLRVRQDRKIFEGLLGTAKTGSGDAEDPVQLALARIRQLSAHEVGHTLGITHNFAASTYGDRESVMDYPAPLVTVDASGELDVSKAYDVGIGDWDIHAVRFAYQEFEGDEQAGLESLLAEGREQGLLFITDADARPAGASHWVGSLWDNGSDPVEQLKTEMAVRSIALDRFGEDRISDGQPLALLEEVLATVYFRHRYQLEATVKMVGGLDYRYALRGDGQPRPTPIDARAQQSALAAVLETISPKALDLPESVLEVMHPRPFGYWGNRELIRGAASPAFDALGAAATAADMTVSMLLQPERAARMVNLHHRDAALPGFRHLLVTLVDHSFAEGTVDGREVELRRVVETVTTERLVALAGDASAAAVVRARAEDALRSIGSRVSARGPSSAHDAMIVGTVHRFLDRGGAMAVAGEGAKALPPGSPIGSWQPADHLGGCSMDSPGFGR